MSARCPLADRAIATTATRVRPAVGNLPVGAPRRGSLVRMRRLGGFLVAIGLVACGKVSADRPDAQLDAPLIQPDAPPGIATLTVTVTGSGTVSSTPAGISCGADCSESFPIGSAVMLTPTPDVGSTFAGWTGGGCSGTGACTVMVAAMTTVAATFACASGSQTFDFTGAPQQLTRPACVTSIHVDVQGGAGGASSSAGAGGLGGRVEATLPILSSDVITVFVGGAGGVGGATPGPGGFNGGGAAGNLTAQAGGGGGGASDIRVGGTDLTARVVVAGGGGGGSTACALAFAGGAGGGQTGGTPEDMSACGTPTNSASGGTQSAGGVGGLYLGYVAGGGGTLGIGGSAAAGNGGGGAGGGYFGGGGGCWMGGGGGSSFAGTTATGVIHTQNFRAGAGTVTITW